MDDSFSGCSDLGDKGEQLVVSELRKRYSHVKTVPKEIGLQLEWGDIVVPALASLGIKSLKIEVKTEARYTGNLFWEWWSNRAQGREGWGQTSPADELYYLFWDEGIGYRLTGLQNLKFQVDYHRGNFKLVEQSKHSQANDTWGYLIPIDWFRSDEVTKFELEKENPSEEGLKTTGRVVGTRMGLKGEPHCGILRVRPPRTS